MLAVWTTQLSYTILPSPLYKNSYIQSTRFFVNILHHIILPGKYFTDSDSPVCYETVKWAIYSSLIEYQYSFVGGNH